MTNAAHIRLQAFPADVMVDPNFHPH